MTTHRVEIDVVFFVVLVLEDGDEEEEEEEEEEEDDDEGTQKDLWKGMSVRPLTVCVLSKLRLAPSLRGEERLGRNTDAPPKLGSWHWNVHRTTQKIWLAVCWSVLETGPRKGYKVDTLHTQ